MTKITAVLSTTPDGLIKADRGGLDINEMEHLQGLGDDSQPLDGDVGLSWRLNKSGYDAFIGAFDYDNKVATKGEKRIYARNLNGEVVSHVYLKGDGEILSANDNCSVTQKSDGTIISTNGSGTHTVNADGSIESVNSGGHIKLLSSGAVDINGFLIQPNGAATSPISVGAPIITSATMTANGSGVAMNGTIKINGEDYEIHFHLPGTLKDAEGRPITGNTGGKG